MKLELLPEALAELNDSIAFYEEQEAGLGARFFASIVAAIELAAENPRLGSALPPPATGVRKFVVERFRSFGGSSGRRAERPPGPLTSPARAT